MTKEFICKFEECTGCSACYNICPQKAISMVENSEGFLYPKIDETKCINCGKCKYICPNNTEKQFYQENQKAYSAYASDEILQNKTSSGGAFTVFAQYILKQNGIVCASAFNPKMQAEHIIVDNINDLIKLRGSKYLQSNLNDSFKLIKDYLEQNRKVLFTGTPCQAAGLKNFLKKDYENLLVVDLICHGVPSFKIFKKYLDENYINKNIIDVNFRDKKCGWSSGCNILSVKTDNDIIYTNSSIDDYYKVFFSHIGLRPSCYSCKYAQIKRIGDITLGDFWGIPKKYMYKYGVSAILLNNKKARVFFEKVKKDFVLAKEFSVEIVKQGQPHLYKPAVPHPARKNFMEDINKMTLKEALDKNLCSAKNVAIINYHWENKNFGAVITAYALNKVVSNLGYNAQNINYPIRQSFVAEEPENKYFDDFRKKYIPETKRFNSPQELTLLNETFSNFITGSDQVFRSWLVQFDMDAFLLSFANVDKNIMSYSASFGIKMENKKSTEDKIFYLLLSNFDSLSLRENNGADYCKNLGIDNAVQLIDPVFLLNKEEWKYLFSDKKYENIHSKIIIYTVNPNIKNEIMNFIKTNPALDTKNLRDITFNTPVEEWLAEVANCDLFITDSFHGVCFAIIFNKPFICVHKSKDTIERLKSLFEIFGIENRLYNNFDDVNVNKIIKSKIDYDKINKIIEAKKAEGIEYLEKSLGKNVSLEKQAKKRENLKKYFTLQKRQYNKLYKKYLIRYFRYKVMYILFRKEKFYEKMNNRKYIYMVFKKNRNFCKKNLKLLKKGKI